MAAVQTKQDWQAGEATFVEDACRAMSLPLPRTGSTTVGKRNYAPEASHKNYDPGLLTLPRFLKRDLLWFNKGPQTNVQVEFVVDNASLADLANGVLAIKNDFYKAPVHRIRNRIREIFDVVQYKGLFLEPVDWRPREYNTAADHIANYILDQGRDETSWEERVVLDNLDNIRGLQIFSDGGYAARGGRNKVGAAAVVIVVIPREGGADNAYIAGWAGWFLAHARSAFEAEVIALDKAVELAIKVVGACEKNRH